MTRHRIGVYDLYWSTMGGGEQVDGTIAEVLAANGHDVILFGPEPPEAEALSRRLGIDVSRCGYETVRDDAEATEASATVDLFVNGTYLSRAANRAPVGWYYVHFPGTVPTRSDVVAQRVARIGSRVLAGRDGRLARVRDGFERRRIDQDHLATYDRFFANSAFTGGWVDRLWNVRSQVLYPPVRPRHVSPVDGRSRLIVSVGRFFDASRGHSKKQHELLEAFLRLRRRGEGEGWRLAFVGGAGPEDREYALEMKRRLRDLPPGVDVELHLDAPGPVVRRLLGEASILWHGAGLGEDPDTHPERFEHFGIAVVEAMAAGAVPVVFAAAGPAEVVRDGIDGLHVTDVDGFATATARLIADPVQRSRLAASARERAKQYSVDVFGAQVRRWAQNDLSGDLVAKRFARTPRDHRADLRPESEPDAAS